MRTKHRFASFDAERRRWRFSNRPQQPRIERDQTENKHVAGECPDAEDMEMACSPWYRSVIRDPGDYEGQRRKADPSPESET